MIKIALFQDGKPVGEFSCDRGKEISIGRAPACTIRLADPTISRLHAIIRFAPAGWIIEKKSNYGQLAVNGEEIENAILQGGEEIVVLAYILRVNLDEEGASEEIAVESLAKPTPATEPYPNEATQEPYSSAEPAAQAEQDIEEVAGQYVAKDQSRTNIVKNLAYGYLRFEPGMANVNEFVIKKDHVQVGRASSCDVILFEKKASRKHFEIRRQGLSYILRDLGSANGTFVNTKKIDSVDLVPGDVIQVGDSRCEFSIESKEFFSKRDQFIPVPAAALPEGGISENALSGEATRGGFELGIPQMGRSAGGSSGGDAAPVEKSLIKRAFQKYRSMPLRQRMIVLLLLLLLPGALFNTGENADKKPKPKITRAADGTIIRRYEDLTDADKKKVNEAYGAIIKSREEKNYQKMLDEVATILRYVNDYRDVRLYETEAKRGIEEEERRLQEEKVKAFQEKIAAEVKEMVRGGERLFEQALADPLKRPALESLVQEIYSKDPNNSTAQSWQAQIRAKIEDEAKEKERLAVEQRLKERAEAEFAKLEEKARERKFIEALQYADTVAAVGYEKEGFPEKLEAKKNEIRAELSSVIEPLLVEAEKDRQPGGDLVKAKDSFLKVLEVDPENPRALTGLDAISEVLHLRAKRLYAQAIIAESVSSLDEAEKTLKDCVKVAPEKDPYKRRCQAKLAKYQAFSKEDK